MPHNIASIPSSGLIGVEIQMQIALEWSQEGLVEGSKPQLTLVIIFFITVLTHMVGDNAITQVTRPFKFQES